MEDHLQTDLNKASGSNLHYFLIAKSKAYSFSYEALKLMRRYLTNRRAKTKN